MAEKYCFVRRDRAIASMAAIVLATTAFSLARQQQGGATPRRKRSGKQRNKSYAKGRRR